jgi:tRNA threonylcarbamoyladenosine biosynthesis protein TsaB
MISPMIRALAIETSSRIGSVALVQDGAVVGETTFPHGLEHAARIVTSIDELCRQAQWAATDLCEIYVSAGPGSFTGLRIGITLAKTFAFATGAKLVAVPSVRVLVENAPPQAQNVAIVLDAKRDQIYSALFERAGETWIEREPAHLDSLVDVLSRALRPVHLLGEGIPHHEKFIPKNDPGIMVTPQDSWRPRAQSVAKIGWQMARRGDFTDALALTPVYIRRPEAEEKYDARVTRS